MSQTFTLYILLTPLQAQMSIFTNWPEIRNASVPRMRARAMCELCKLINMHCWYKGLGGFNSVCEWNSHLIDYCTMNKLFLGYNAQIYYGIFSFCTSNIITYCYLVLYKDYIVVCVIKRQIYQLTYLYHYLSRQCKTKIKSRLSTMYIGNVMLFPRRHCNEQLRNMLACSPLKDEHALATWNRQFIFHSYIICL